MPPFAPEPFDHARLGPGRPIVLDQSNLTWRQEGYARCVAAGMSYSEAFRLGGCVATSPGSKSRQIADLNRHPGVTARIRELSEAADQDTVKALNDRMHWLRLIISARPEELTRIRVDACSFCWTDDAIARAVSEHYAGHPFGERPPLPDETKPNDRCDHCKGDGIARVVLTPTDELSPAGRALFKGAMQDDKGVIKLYMQDQLAAADMLNKLQALYITKSLNLNLNATVPAARDVSTEDMGRLFSAFDSPPAGG
jgi:hypothetical protein